MFFKCSFYVLLSSTAKSVLDRRYSLSSLESYEHPANLELNWKRNESECAGYTYSVVVRCVFVLFCKRPQFIRYSFVGCSLCSVTFVIRAFHPFNVRFVFLLIRLHTVDWPVLCSFLVRGNRPMFVACTFMCAVRLHRIQYFSYGDVRRPSPDKCDRDCIWNHHGKCIQ